MKRLMILLLLSAGLLLSACAAGEQQDETSDTNEISSVSEEEEAEEETDSDNGESAAKASDFPEKENEAVSEEAEESDESSDELFTERDLEQGWDASEAVDIVLNGSTASCDDTGAVEIKDNRITINAAGTYILSGNWQGMVIVDAEKTDSVQLVLSGADITSENSAAIYVRRAKKVFLTTAAGTENGLSNGGSYVAIDEYNIDAVVFSKDDLTMNGEGSLTIDAAAGAGVAGKDDLKLTGGSYKITAETHGISANDSVRIADGDYSVTAGTDGIHCDGDVYIASGTFSLAVGDDAIHADGNVTITGGDIDISSSYEGIEGLSIEITGGNIVLSATDDGLNAAASKEDNTDNRFGGMFAATEGADITIKGGNLTIRAGGDGIDSNGTLEIEGGEILIYGPTSNANSALDWQSGGMITGGTLIALGSSGMAQNFGSSSTQGTMLLLADGKADDEVVLSDAAGNILLQTKAEKTFSCVILSCAELTVGESYTLRVGETETEIEMSELLYSDITRGGWTNGEGENGPMNGGGNRRESNGEPGQQQQNWQQDRKATNTSARSDGEKNNSSKSLLSKKEL